MQAYRGGMAGDQRVRDEGTPVGRRVFIGLVGLGALGVVGGARLQDRAERRARADRDPGPDRAGRAAPPRQHLPLLLGHRRGGPARRPGLPAAVTGLVDRPGRAHPGRPAGHAADRAGARLPVRHGLAGARGAVGRRPAGAPARPGRPGAGGDGGAADLLRRHVHREPDPGAGPAGRRPGRAPDARRPGHPRPRRAGAALRGADVRLQEHQVAVRDRADPRRRARLLGGPRLLRRRLGRRSNGRDDDPTG